MLYLCAIFRVKRFDKNLRASSLCMRNKSQIVLIKNIFLEFNRNLPSKFQTNSKNKVKFSNVVTLFTIEIIHYLGITEVIITYRNQ